MIDPVGSSTDSYRRAHRSILGAFAHPDIGMGGLASYPSDELPDPWMCCQLLQSVIAARQFRFREEGVNLFMARATEPDGLVALFATGATAHPCALMQRSGKQMMAREQAGFPFAKRTIARVGGSHWPQILLGGCWPDEIFLRGAWHFALPLKRR